MNDTDILIIGAGSAGLTVAYTARGFGKSVVLVDRNLPGGGCTWNGCIPSKAFISQANDIFTAHKYADFTADTSSIMKKTRDIISKVYEDESNEVLRKNNIDFIQGNAKFIDESSLDVNGRIIKAGKIFICSGSVPLIPPIDGILDVESLTNENFFLLDKLPGSMIVVGAGAVGAELSQAMNRIGVRVDLVEMADNILPKEDSELAGILKMQMEREGVRIHTSSKAVHISMKDNKVNLMTTGQAGDKMITGEQILFALGREPDIKGLDLEKAGVAYDKTGIKVNNHMQTSNRNIYTAGDVTGKYPFSHVAEAQGIIAVRNAVLPFKKKMDYDNIAWCTFTSPELAAAGMSENEAKTKYGDAIRVYRYNFDHIDRAKTEGDTTGLVKIICNKNGKVLGCSILGEIAGDLISEIQVIKTLEIRLKKLAGVIHPYPTYAEVFNKIGKKALIDSLFDLPLVGLFRKNISKK